MARTLLFLALVLGALAATYDAAAAPAKRPNIIFILADDMRRGDVVAVPRTRRLVGDAGVVLRKAFVDVPLCCPSRATTLTGQYPQNTHVYANAGDEGGYATFRRWGNERATIATMLHAAGYRTGLIGKYLNGYPLRSQKDLVPSGWDYWAALTSDFYQQYDYDIVQTDGSRRHYGTKPADYAGDVLRDRALDFIKEAAADPRRRPFLLYLAFVSPHGPATAAPRHAGLYRDADLPATPSRRETDLGDKPPFYQRPELTSAQRRTILAGHRQRLRSLASVDEAVAAIVGQLRTMGILEDTFIVFTSDNGFKLGEHQLGVGKQTDFESDVHVPAMIRGPGLATGSATQLLASNVDYSPTFAELAGTTPGRPQDGRSLLPILRAGAGPAVWRTSLLLAHKKAGSSTEDADTLEDQRRTGLFSGVPTVNPPDYFGLRTGRYLLTRFATGDGQFYDLARDPWELANRHAKPAGPLERALAERARQLRTCAGAACVRLENAPLPGTP